MDAHRAHVDRTIHSFCFNSCELCFVSLQRRPRRGRTSAESWTMSDGADQESGAVVAPTATQTASTSSEETTSGSTSPHSSPPHAQNGAAATAASTPAASAGTSASTAASGSGAGSTAQQASSSITNTANQEQSVRRRVKLYLLNAERQWDDKGTGYVSSPYVDALGGISLVVRAEIDGELQQIFVV